MCTGVHFRVHIAGYIRLYAGAGALGFLFRISENHVVAAGDFVALFGCGPQCDGACVLREGAKLGRVGLGEGAAPTGLVTVVTVARAAGRDIQERRRW